MSTASDHAAEIATFRERRLRNLLADDGWLTVVGLEMLAEGPNALPIGTFTVTGGAVHFVARPGVTVLLRGARVADERVLKSDAAPDPDVLEVDGLRYTVIRRGGAYAVRVRDPASPTRRAFPGIPTYPLDPSWRIAARLEPYEPPKPIELAYAIGTVATRFAPGALVFTWQGREVRLDPVTEHDGRLFLLFRDETNRDETYGAGRFLYMPSPQSAEIVVDFNKAINPPCAFTPHATCPIVPPQNRLAFRVEAGEKIHPA